MTTSSHPVKTSNYEKKKKEKDKVRVCGLKILKSLTTKMTPGGALPG